MKKELHLEILPYKKEALSPVMSEGTIKYHRDKLAAGYVNRFNSGEGDANFNEAGAFLHNIFFPQLKPPAGRNLPHGISLEIIESKYKTYDAFKEAVKDVAMKIQGSGWVYMDCSGEIKTIKDHQIKPKIALLIDWWEHAWALDYQHDKAKYLDNIWKIINWDVVNDRLNTSAGKIKVGRDTSIVQDLVKLADHLDMLKLSDEALFVDELIKESAKKKRSKRTPTNPELWTRAKAKAKAKYDVWPSAYSIGFALREYKKMGGGWRGKKPIK